MAVKAQQLSQMDFSSIYQYDFPCCLNDFSNIFLQRGLILIVVVTLESSSKSLCEKARIPLPVTCSVKEVFQCGVNICICLTLKKERPSLTSGLPNNT